MLNNNTILVIIMTIIIQNIIIIINFQTFVFCFVFSDTPNTTDTTANY